MHDQIHNIDHIIEKKTTMNSRAIGIQGLIGIVVLIIALFHFDIYFPIRNHTIFTSGYLGIEFLFVLSGFLIAKEYDSKFKTDNFFVMQEMKKMIIRLYPPYLAANLLLIIMYSVLMFKGNIFLWINSDKNHLDGLLSEIFCIQTTGVSNFNYVNGPAWYVSALIIASFFILLFHKIFKQLFIKYIAPLCSIILYILLFYFNTYMDPNSFILCFVPTALIRALAGMMLGSFIFFIFISLKDKINNLKYWQISTLEIIFTVGFFAMLLFRQPSRWNYLVFMPIIGIIVVMFSAEGFVSKIFSKKLFKFLGITSYSFYLLHSICSNFIINVLNFIPQPYITIIYLVINFIAALLFYYIIEMGLVKNIFSKYQWSKIFFGVFIFSIVGIILLKCIDSNNSNAERGDKVVITALGEQNVLAQGSEVWIIGAYIDDVWYDAVDMFDLGWIEDSGKIGWRSYDQLENMQPEIIGYIPYGKNRKIILESNRWRGKAEVKVLDKIYIFDGYSNLDLNNSSVELLSNVKPTIDNESIIKIDNKFWLFMLIAYTIFLYKYIIISTRNGNVKKTNFENRQIWADILRIFCIFNVILLHGTVGAYTSFTDDITNWYRFLYINSFTACAVPIFFMISGAFVIKEEKDFLSTLKKRLKKILIPLFIWSLIYIILRKYYLHENIDIIKAIIKIPMESQYSHLWFIYTLCSIYLMCPIISYIYYRTDKKILGYIFVLTGVIPLVFKTLEVSIGYSLNISAFFIGFPEVMLFILGKYIVDNKNKIIQRWYIWAFISFLGYSMVIVLSYYFSIKLNSPYKGFFSNYGTIPIFIMYVALFIMFLSLQNVFKQLNIRVKKLLYIISDAGMSIYFTHMLIYYIIEKKSIFGIYTITVNSGRLLDMCIAAILNFIISFVIVQVIKYLKNVILINTLEG